MIPYGRQCLDEADIEAVVGVLRSDWLTQGPAIERFEAAVARAVAAPFAVAVSNATAGLHLACLAMDIGPGDRVWTSPITFVASANCARYCGAEIDFVDIDPATLNLDVRALEAKLQAAERAGRLPKLVIPVHFAGQSCAMAEIGALAERYGFQVLEDAAHAIGGSYQGTPVGSCQHSRAAVFSFHPVKIVTTGEGGVIVTRDERLYRRLIQLRSHGITRDPAAMAAVDPAPWFYEQHDLGFNYRMTDLQAALGASQMTKLEAFVSRRRELVARYGRLLGDSPLVLPSAAAGCAPSWHLYVIQVPRPERREAVFSTLRAAGIGVNVHYIPVHTQPYYRSLGFAPGQFPVAERYYERALSLPLFACLSDQEQDFVAATLLQALR